MAVVKAYYSIDMLDVETWFGDVTIANYRTIQIESGGWEGTYSGAFRYDSDGGVHGRLNGYVESYHGTWLFSVTQIDRDAATYLWYLDQDDSWGASRYVLSGADQITGSSYDDTLLGFGGNDVLQGGAGVDILLGMEGDDVLEGGTSGDGLDGGVGADRAIFSGSVAATVNLNSTAVQNTGYGGDILVSIEHLTTGSGNDRLIGNAAANSFLSNAGNDMLTGNAGNDSLISGLGNDTLDGGAGNDLLDGGAGTDWLVFAGAQAVQVILANGASQNTGQGWDMIRGIENVTSGSGNDRLTGSVLANVLSSGAGNDLLIGNGGDDMLLGGVGNDVLLGGAGRDTLVGGAGYDEFRFQSPAEAGRGMTRDVIRDFQVGVDDIDLSVIDANARVAGNQAFRFIGASSFTGHAGELTMRGGILSGDVNGDRIADFEIAVQASGTLAARDFDL